MGQDPVLDLVIGHLVDTVRMSQERQHPWKPVFILDLKVDTFKAFLAADEACPCRR
jgi:hypothetical protein